MKPKKPISGAKLGFILAVMYGQVFNLLTLFGTLFSRSPYRSAPSSAIFYAASSLIFIVIFMGGIGALLGWITSAILEAIVSSKSKSFTRRGTIFAGAAVALMFVIFIHVISRAPFRWMGSSYWGVLGIPSLIYIAASVWMSLQLNRYKQAQAQVSFYKKMGAKRAILDAIAQRSPYETRYEIDLRLLQQGYDSRDIETAWQVFFNSSQCRV